MRRTSAASATVILHPWRTQMTVSTPGHAAAAVPIPVTHHRTNAVDGVNVFYRQAGPGDAPAVLLLHGFPTSSTCSESDPVPCRPIPRDRAQLCRLRAKRRPRSQCVRLHVRPFRQLVDGLLDQLRVTRYAIYVMDYGAPVGWRLASRIPNVSPPSSCRTAMPTKKVCENFGPD